MPKRRIRLPDWLRQSWNVVRFRGRKVWQNDVRLHVALREMTSAELAAFSREVERRLPRVDGVLWARVNSYLGAVVVRVESPRCDPYAVVCAIERLETEHGLPRRRFERDRPERHPGDPGPVTRAAGETALEVSSLAAGAVLQRLGVKKIPVEFDLAAFLAAVESIPRVRKTLEELTSIPATELGLETARALISCLLQGRLGPAVSVVSRGLRVRELAERRRLWEQREEELCGDSARFPGPADELAPRPGRAPEGPIERYTGRAIPASLGGLLAALAASHHLEDSVGAIFAGIPRPASLGRDAYASHLGYLLARAGILVLEPHILRRLERHDTLLLAGGDFIDELGARRLDEAAREAGLRVIVLGDGSDPVRAIRAAQERGAGVCFVARGPSPGYAAADLGIGIAPEGGAIPWGAHVFVRPGGEDVLAILRAMSNARVAARDGVRFSAVEAACAAGVAFAGLSERATERMMSLSNVASFLSMANGVRLAHAVRPRAAGGANGETPAPVRWHALSAEEALERLETSSAGLAHGEAARRRRPPAPPPSRFSSFARMVAAELANPMAPVLAAGAGLSAVAGAPVDAALVGGVIVVNSVFGGVERYQTERALAGLGRSERARVRVRRSGEMRLIEASELVVGDVIEAAAGDVVPADCRILEASGLEVDESGLTGESLPVPKSREPVEAAALADRTSMLYDGTTVAAGTVLAAVTAIGEETETRRAVALAGEPPASGVEKRLETLTALSAPLAAAGGAALAAAGAIRRRPLREVVSTGVGLAVAAVPEGLPLIATMSQLAAARRLSRRGALARNPRAVEALGRVDVLCADKTGTLTQGRLALRLVSDGLTETSPRRLDPQHRRIVAAALRASPSTTGGERLTHLTDRALVESARGAGVSSHEGLAGWRRLDQLPFEPGRGFHAGLARFEGGRLLSVKGAPEVILPRCDAWRRGRDVVPIEDAGRAQLLEEAERLAGRGLRVLAVAEREARSEGPINGDRVSRLVFDGFLGFADPVRGIARKAVEDIRSAGVQVIMVTGDHPSTAEAIAAELGVENGRVVSGPEIDELDDAELAELIERAGVFARVSPAQKVRIVRAFQSKGRAVAMTGDGANDAPAIRLADVGIALGERATPAARSAADIVVTDDRIETIVSALLEGRALWTSVRDAVAILTGGNLGEIGFTVLGGLLSRTPPLNARQLLLVNLVTDSLPALAIALRPPLHHTPDELAAEGPEASLGRALVRDVTWRGLVTLGSAGAAYAAARLTGGRAAASSAALLALTGSQLGQMLAVGGKSKAVWVSGLGSLAATALAVETPGLSRFFGCRPLGPIGLAQAATATAAATGASFVLSRRYARRAGDQSVSGKSR